MNPHRILSPVPRLWPLWALAAVLAAGGLETAAQETNRVVRPDYGAFKIISDRNIFNVNRSGGTPSRPRGEGPRASKVDAFRLVGIMEYDKGVFAFFDGTSSDYRQALQPAGKIAGYTITNVTPEVVTLDAEGKQIELHVGSQVRREDNGEWQTVVSGDLPATPASGTTSTEGSGDNPGGEISDVLKKLMQQREQEQK